MHADDHAGDEEHTGEAHGVATSEAVPLSAVRTVMLTHVVGKPAEYPARRRANDLAGRDITLTIGWGGVSRVDLEVAGCGDPHCDADHGYTGTLAGDDLALRISADAEGAAALQDALAFARLLSAATAYAVADRMTSAGPVVPDYDGRRARPGAAGRGRRARGPTCTARPDWDLPAADRVCVVLVDGLGYENLADPAHPRAVPQGRAARIAGCCGPASRPPPRCRWVRSVPAGRRASTGWSGTRCSTRHATGLFNGLKWADDVDPLAWQPYPTVFGAAGRRRACRPFRIGPDRFDGSGLTEAALRGGSFVAATKLHDATRAAPRRC